MRTRRYETEIQPYGGRLLLIIADDVVKAKDRLFKIKNWQYDQDAMDDDETLDEAIFLYDSPDSKEYVLILTPQASPGTIAHEVGHLACKLLVTCGVDIINNNEPHAYLVGHLTDLIWGKIHKK